MKPSVFILTGFLGSGKTTLLQKWLEFLLRKQYTVAVVMNEVGEFDIDGRVIESGRPDIPIKKMLDGCICCSIRGDLNQGISNLIEQFNPQIILVETTGVAFPTDIIIDLMDDQELMQGIDMKGIITLVDASQYQSLMSRLGTGKALEFTYRNQISSADILILNKSDLLAVDEVNQVRQKVLQDNPNATVYTTSYGEIEYSVLMDLNGKKKEQFTSSSALSNKVSHRKNVNQLAMQNDCDYVESFFYPFNGSVDREKFHSFLADLPNSIYRAKGFVKFDSSVLHSFHYTTGNQIIFSPCSGSQDETIQTAVFIGSGIDKREMVARINETYFR